MGDTGEQSNKQPTATQGETRWKNKREWNHCNPMGNAEEKRNDMYKNVKKMKRE